MSKHTTGPWKLSRYSNSDIFVDSPKTGRIIYEASEFDGEGVANAALISAAPDLLAAAQVVVKCLRIANLTEVERRWAETLEAAIAKAMGEK